MISALDHLWGIEFWVLWTSTGRKFSLFPHSFESERDRLLGIFANTAYVALIANPFWVLELASQECPGCLHPSGP